MSNFAYNFPAIRGVQAGRAYYAAMVPLRILAKIFPVDDDDLPPELRAQRILNKARIPEIARYIVSNPSDYVFSSLAGSIDRDVVFESAGGDKPSVGLLKIPMDARFLLNDGQHRRAAIEQALHDLPELGDETISVVLFVDPGTERAQQMFSDLNRHAIRPGRSLGLLYDHRHDGAWVAREVARRSKAFTGLVENERSNLAPRSTKLFTLSAIATATEILVADCDEGRDPRLALAIDFWNEVSEHMWDWKQVRARKATSPDVRRDSIAAHGIALAAIATAGRVLLRERPQDWRRSLRALAEIDWSRGNAGDWEGRAMTNGRVSKSSQHVQLSSSFVKRRLELPLSPAEHEFERAREARA